MGRESCCGALGKHVAGKGMRQVRKVASMPDPDTKSGFGQSWDEDRYPGFVPMKNQSWDEDCSPGLGGQFMQGLQGQSWEVASGAAGGGGGGCTL